ncbi:MAG: hypothetical protein AAGF13_08965 [Pseudomonadota bacterium]
MKKFFIGSLEIIVGILVVLGIVVTCFGAFFVSQDPTGGMAAGIGVLVAGFIYITMFAGAFYLLLGVYDNTKKTAEILDRLSSQGRIGRD